jgi:hypothetical protein
MMPRFISACSPTTACAPGSCRASGPQSADRNLPRCAAQRREDRHEDLAARRNAETFDAYVAADFVWATLRRGTRRVQMFHGVAGKWSEII